MAVVPDIESDMTPPGRTVRDQLRDRNGGEEEAPKPRGRPRKAAGARKASTPSSGATDWVVLRDDLVTGYQFIGTMSMAFSPNGGMALAGEAERCADAWIRQAEKSERIRRFLMTITEGGGWLTLVIVHAPIAMAFMHDLRSPRDAHEPGMAERVETFMANMGEEVPA